MFSSSTFLSAHCHHQPFFTPVSSKFPPLPWPFLKARTTMQLAHTSDNLRTRQNADKLNTDSDRFRFFFFDFFFCGNDRHQPRISISVPRKSTLTQKNPTPDQMNVYLPHLPTFTLRNHTPLQYKHLKPQHQSFIRFLSHSHYYCTPPTPPKKVCKELHK